MTTCYIHIGATKCGSSHIQNFINTNKNILQSRLVNAPSEFNNSNRWKLSTFCSKPHSIEYISQTQKLSSTEIENQISQFLETTKEQRCEYFKYKKIIISNEFFYSQCKSIDSINILRKLLQDIGFKEFRVFFVYRNQSSLFKSSYSQLTVGPSKMSMSYRRFIEWGLSDKYFCNFKQTVENWSNAFGKRNIVLCKLEETSSIENTFLDFLGISNEQMDFKYKTKKTNKKSGYLNIALVRMSNWVFKKFSRVDSIHTLNKRISKALTHDRVPAIGNFPVKYDSEVMHRFSEENLYLKNNFKHLA